MTSRCWTPNEAIRWMAPVDKSLTVSSASDLQSRLQGNVTSSGTHRFAKATQMEGRKATPLIYKDLYIVKERCEHILKMLHRFIFKRWWDYLKNYHQICDKLHSAALLNWTAQSGGVSTPSKRTRVSTEMCLPMSQKKHSRSNLPTSSDKQAMEHLTKHPFYDSICPVSASFSTQWFLEL